MAILSLIYAECFSYSTCGVLCGVPYGKNKVFCMCKGFLCRCLFIKIFQRFFSWRCYKGEPQHMEELHDGMVDKGCTGALGP